MSKSKFPKELLLILLFFAIIVGMILVKVFIIK
jgi:hypothetical protein